MEKIGKFVYEGVVGYVTLFVIITSGQFFASSTAKIYYQYAPIEKFLVTPEIAADDMCYGDLRHTWKGARFVYVDPGLSADIIRELFIQTSDGSFAKISEDSANVFIESSMNGSASRIQMYERPLPTGKYKWQISYRALYLPHGVVRTDVPPTLTSVFNVERCKN